MEENEGTQVCPNCNREIPKVNFITHSVHCVRNIKICPVCKEPVPQSELEDHTDRLHLLVPCNQCGEMVRGTDMEDHTRDSCALTMQSCRFCSLELRRRDVPAHERYCGARTERCADCGEYVMVRYRQLHIESNHSFVRLDDDPPTRPTGAVNNSIPNRPPMHRRPRFPPYVPLADFIRPSVSEEDSLRMIAQCRAMQTEPDQFPNMTNEDIRRKMMNSVPPIQPDPVVEDRPNDDEAPRRYRDRQKQALLANLRGRIGARFSYEPPARNARLRDARLRDPTARDAQAREAEAAQEQEARNELVRAPMAEEVLSLEPQPRAIDVGEALVAQLLSVETDSEQDVFNVPDCSRPHPVANRVILKRTNDQPQINTTVVAQDKVQKKLGTRGAVKKRPAPAAPASSSSSASSSGGVAPSTPEPTATPPPAPDPRRDLPYYSALQRRQDEDRRRNEQTAYNLSVGLPPVLDPAAKLEKLRKMDALHNRETDNEDYSQRLQGRVWYNNNFMPAGRTLGHAPTSLSPAALPTADTEQQRSQLEDLQPMSAEEFMERFNDLQLFKEPSTGGDDARGRFGDIRSSLRELRRGLNEVTAPYNNSATNNNNNNSSSNNNNNNNNYSMAESSRLINQILNGTIVDSCELDEARALMPTDQSPEADVMVPCEFCCEPLRANEILDHERACRQALLTGRGMTTSPTPPITPTLSSRPPSPWYDDSIPVIPCEFCTETLPFYLINEHQELCRRGVQQLLFPD